MESLPRVRVFSGKHRGKEGSIVYYNQHAHLQLTIVVDSPASGGRIEVRKDMVELAPGTAV